MYYDDMCHLKVSIKFAFRNFKFVFSQPYSENPERANRNDVTKKFSEIKKYVDFFHFKGR